MTTSTPRPRSLPPLRNLAAPAAWVAALLLGAAALRAVRVEDFSTPLAAVLRSEAVHVPAHLLLYGTLAALCRRLFNGRRAPALLAVLAAGLAQEIVQNVPFGAGFGGPEVFDLAVDAAAAVAVLWAPRRAARASGHVER